MIVWIWQSLHDYPPLSGNGAPPAPRPQQDETAIPVVGTVSHVGLAMNFGPAAGTGLPT